MSSQIQGIAGNGRNVNKKLRVPATLGPISRLFDVLWRHYPGTVFEENETTDTLSKRMREWQHEILARQRVPVTVLRDVADDLDGQPPHIRDVRCPDLDKVIDLCHERMADLEQPRDEEMVNAHRQRIKQMMRG